MPNVSGMFTGDKIKAAGQYADTRAPAEGGAQSPQGGAMDVWKHSWNALKSDGEKLAADPTRIVTDTANYIGDMGHALSEGLVRTEHSQDLDGMTESASAQLDALGDKAAAIGKANGALATVGATFNLLIAAEQLISTPLSMIPSPALPALRISDMDFGMPHGHAHPPNLTPLGMIFLPSTGPVIPIPIISGASRTLINNLPAARCGDIGLSIWCGSYVPLYEVFLGSSSVWIEGARAARMGIDITNHCIFSARPRPGDPPIGPFVGTTYTGSPNVIIGGVPLPSLLSLGIGQLFKVMFAGVAKIAGKIRASRAAKEVVEEVAEQADEAADFADDVTEEITAVSPPPSMAPAVDAIDNILWQFSQSVRDLVRLSPTLSDQLARLDNMGWDIFRGKGTQSFCNRDMDYIRIAQHGDPAREVSTIAHEAGHAFYQLEDYVSPVGLTRDEFVNSNVARHMRDEGAAQMNSAKVRDELRQNGADMPMPGSQAEQYGDVYDRFKAGELSEAEAMDEMGNIMRNEVNSVDNRPYGDYYGDGYHQRYDDYAANQPGGGSTPGGSSTTADPDAGDTLPGWGAPDSGSGANAGDAADTIPDMPTASDTVPDMPTASDTIPELSDFSNDFGDTLPGVPPPGSP